MLGQPHASVPDEYMAADVEAALASFHADWSVAHDEKSVDAFDRLAGELLHRWETDAPEGLTKSIDWLRRYHSISSRVDAAENLTELGAGSRGASLALLGLLGDNSTIVPGEIFWLFGAKSFIANSKAAEALVAMREWAIIPLIYAISHDFAADERNKATTAKARMGALAPAKARKEMAASTLQMLTGQEYGTDGTAWIEWFKRTDPAQLVKGKQVDVELPGSDAKVPYYKNPFLVCLALGAAITIYGTWKLRVARRDK